jgi:hypothetical protein
MLSLPITVIISLHAHAAAFEAEREPPSPELKKQYRLVLRTSGHPCSDWRKVTPTLGKDDLLVSSSRRDEEGKGCRFLWIVTPAEPVGTTQFELERFGGKTKETFELAAPTGFQAPKPAASPSPFTLGIPGIANENGTGPADPGTHGKVNLPGGLNVPPAK